MQKAEILETVAGKTRATAAAAILESPKLLEQAYADAMENASGAGKKAVETSMESINKKINVVKNDLKQLAIESLENKSVMNIVDSVDSIINKIRETDLGSTLTALADLLNLALKIINISPVGGVLGAVLMGKGAFGKNSLLNNKIVRQFKLQPDALISASDLRIIQSCTDGINNNAEAYSNLEASLVALSPEAQRYVKLQMDNNVAAADVTAGAKQQAIATKTLTMAQSALNAVLSFGVSILATLLVQKINDLIHAEDNLKKSAKEVGSEFKRLESDIDEYKTKISDLTAKIDDNNTSVKDSAQYRNDLYDIQKTLIEQYGTEASTIDLITKAIHGEIDALDELKRKKWEETERKFNEEHSSMTDKSVSVLDWFIAAFSGNEMAATASSAAMGGNIHKSASQIAYERWLEGDNEWADIAEQYFQYNVLEKEYKEQYDKLRALNDEYSEKLANGELTPDIEKEYAEKSNEIAREIAGSNDNIVEAIYSIFTDLKTNRANYRYNVDQIRGIEKQAEDIFANELFNRPISKWLNSEKETVAKFSVDTQKELDAFIAAVDEAKTNGINDINAIFDLYQSKLKEIDETEDVFNKISFSDWLGEQSSFVKEDKEFSNSELLKEYESAIGQFKDFLVNDRQGQVEVSLSDILRVTGDPDSFFEAIGMPDFEEYMKKFGNDTSLAMMAYMSEVGNKVEEKFGDNLNTKGLEHLHEQMQEIMIEATGFDPALNVHKIEESYNELVELGKQIEKGYEFSETEMDALILKYPSLKGGIEEVKQVVDETTGEMVTKYNVQGGAIESLINEYADLSNEAIDAWRIIKRGALESTLANLNNLLSLDRILELYDKVVNNQDYRGENVFGVNTSEIIQLVKEYQAEMAQLDAMEKNPSKHYHYKPNEKKDSSNDNDDKDKESKSTLDWLEQYLEKRNRLVEEKNKELENLSKVDILKNDAESITKQLEKLQEGGNVNLLLRPEIDTKELKKKKWKKAGEGVATVYTSTYSNEDGTVAVNFTPIIVDPVTGEYKGVLTPKQLQAYAEGVIAGTREDDLNLQIGAKFTGKNAIKQAEKAAIKIHNLHEQLTETSSDIETQYYDQRKAARDAWNDSLEQDLYAYRVAEQEYLDRMSSGVLFDELAEAAGSQKAARKLVKKIMAGEDINLENMSSELSSAISNMVSNWNSKRDAQEKQIEIGIQLKESDLAQVKEDVEHIVNKYSRAINEYEQRQKTLEHYQTMQTTQGYMQNERYIIALIDNESKELAANIRLRDELAEELKNFIPTTEDELNHWYELKSQVDDATNAIYENQEAIASWQNEVKKLEWELSDKIMEMKYAVTDEADFLINNLSSDNMFKYVREYLGNDAVKTSLYNGEMSDEGLATLAMRFTKRRAYYEQIKAYEDKIADAQELYLKDTANIENLDRLNELQEKQREAISNYNEEKQAILDLVREGYDKQLESLQSLIDKYMEAANAEKDLYDYQKNMEKQTKNIANLRKQMTAYANDTSEEARTKLQQLTVQLQEAEEDRTDTEYQRRLSDQQDILDRMYQSLEDFFNDKMENTDAILKEAKSLVKENIPTVKATLSESLTFSKKAEAQISGTLDNILTSGIGSVKDNLVVADGDIKAVKDSVTAVTSSLASYYSEYEISKQKKESIYNWISSLNTNVGTFNANFSEYVKKFDNQTSSLIEELGKSKGSSGTEKVKQSSSKVKDTASSSTLTTTNGAVLTKASESSVIDISDALNENLSRLYTAYDNSKSIDEAIKSVFKTSGNMTFNLAINLDNVTDYESFIAECKKSKRFENLIQSMTLEMMNGSSNSLKKYSV